MSAASAATYTWSPGGGDGGTGTWNTALTNWNAGAVAWPTSGADHEAVFGGTAGTVTISGSVAANKLTFNAGGYTLGSGTLAFNGTTPTIAIVAGTTTISSIINATAGNVGLNKTGTGTLVFSGANSYAGQTSVLGGVLRLDPGASFNTWPVTIDNATMIIQRNAGSTLFNNNVTLRNGGVLDANNSSSNFNTIRSLAFENGGTLQRSGAANADGNFSLSTLAGNDAVVVSGSAAATISAGLGLHNTTGTSSRFNVADVTASAATDLLVTGVLANGGGGLVNGLTKTGAGTMELRATNTYTGTTTVLAGGLLVGSGGGVSNSSAFVIDSGTLSYANNLGASLNSRPVTVRNGGVVSMGNTSSNWTPIGALTLQNGGTLSATTTPDVNGAYQLSANVTVTGDATSAITTAVALGTSSGISRTFDVADGASATDFLVSGAIVDGNFNFTNNLVKTGAGTMELRASNSYRGETRVLGGRLVLGSGGGFGTSSAFQVDGGTLVIANDTGNSLSDKALTVQNGGVVSMQNTSSTWTRIAGLTLVNGGTLATTTTNDPNGTYQLRGDVTVTGNTTSTIAAALGLRGDTGSRTFDVADGAAGVDLLVSSFIANGSVGITSGLIKAGAGRMVLAGQNTYTGTTQVNAGSLIVNGSVGGDVAVAAGAMLGGSGVLGRTLSGAGLVSVGNSPGIGTAGAVNPSAGTDWVFEITGTAPTWNSGTSASVNDVLRLTDTTPFASNLAAINTVDVLFALSGASPLVEGDYLGGFFIDNEAFDLSAALANGQFRFWVVGEYGSAGDQQVFNVGANGTGVTYSLLSAYDSSLTASYTITQRTVNFGAGDVTGAVTQFVVVPEPASLGVAAIGVALAGWARMRRRRGGDLR